MTDGNFTLQQFQLLTAAQAAKLLAISAAKLRDLATHGDIRYVNIGLGRKRELRRYRLQDIQDFVEGRTLTGTVKWSPRAPIEVTDADLLAAAKAIARDRKRGEREKEWAVLQEKREKQRQETEAWLKKCEDEAVVISERLWLQSRKVRKGKRPHREERRWPEPTPRHQAPLTWPSRRPRRLRSFMRQVSPYRSAPYERKLERLALAGS